MRGTTAGILLVEGNGRLETADSRASDARESYRLGPNTYVTKPPDWPRFQEESRLIADYWPGQAQLEPGVTGY
ncbi:MAG: hypothetical protein WEC75_10265 [Dehalococcoidia bacterium]